MERYGFSVHLGAYDEGKVAQVLDALTGSKTPCQPAVEKLEDGTVSIQFDCELAKFASTIQRPEETPEAAAKNAQSQLKNALEPVIRQLYTKVPFAAAAIGPDPMMTDWEATQLSKSFGIERPEDGFVLQFRGGSRLVTVVVWSDPAREKLLVRSKELIDQIGRGETTLTVSGQMTVDGAYVDYVTSNGWRIRVYNDSSLWGGLEYLVTPEGQIVDFNDLEHAPELKEFAPSQQQLGPVWHWMQL